MLKFEEGRNDEKKLQSVTIRHEVDEKIPQSSV